MPEKSIERLMCGVREVHGYTQPYMSPAVQGEYVRYSDHLEILGEAEKERDDFGHTMDMAVERAGAAEQKLQALHLGLEGEVERYRTEARANQQSVETLHTPKWVDEHRELARKANEEADRLQAFLDQAETAGAE